MRNSEVYCLVSVCNWFAIILKFSIFFFGVVSNGRVVLVLVWYSRRLLYR